MRLVFMGTPSFALPTLEALYEAGHDIVAVYSQPPRPAGRGQKETLSAVHVYAQTHELPVFTPLSLKSPEAQAEFAGHKADAAIVAAYGLLLPQPILNAYPLGCINVHPSLLPRWRGAAPIQRTIMAGDRETGIAIMQMDAGLDTGDVLAIDRIPIAEGTNAGELHYILAERAGPLLLSTLRKLKDGNLKPTKQSHTGMEYAKKITKDDFPINWNQPADRIYHQILGLSPVPGAHFTHNNEIIKVFDATFDNSPVNTPSGTTIDDHLSIACNPGILYPTVLQRTGKKRMPIDEFLNGFHIPAATKLD